MAGFVTDWRRRELLQINTVAELLSCSRCHIYNLLADGRLTAHHPTAVPGKRGIRITRASVETFLKVGVIQPDQYGE